MKETLTRALRPPVLASALRVSLCVGTVLNLVNQGRDLLSPATISWAHLFLNYLVPFMVAGYSGARMVAEDGKDESRG